MWTKIDVFTLALAVATVITEASSLSISNPCSPSPCGRNSICRPTDGYAVCTCHPAYFGVPPNCSPECIVNADCSSNSICYNEKCVDPCPGLCGEDAECKVLNNSPICSCPSGTSGDPFINCKTDGRPCLNNTDCWDELACVNKKCVDPCIGACGENAVCKVVNRAPICQCPQGIPIGDANVKCTTIAQEGIDDPCSPSPCGPNSQCRLVNGQATCSCLPTYQGTPPNCTHPCILDSDCSSDSACINEKCVDLCSGTCGTNANCRVLNHRAICSCPPGMSGEPVKACKSYDMHKPECLKNADCDTDEACIDQQGRNPFF